jgi:hypothetical protein
METHQGKIVMQPLQSTALSISSLPDVMRRSITVLASTIQDQPDVRIARRGAAIKMVGAGLRRKHDDSRSRSRSWRSNHHGRSGTRPGKHDGRARVRCDKADSSDSRSRQGHSDSQSRVCAAIKMQWSRVGAAHRPALSRAAPVGTSSASAFQSAAGPARWVVRWDQV